MIRMCVASDTLIRELVIPEERYAESKKWFEKRDWGSIKSRVLIYPFDSRNLGPFNYDLCVGNEAFSVRTKSEILISKKKDVAIEPDDVLLVLTNEYIGLPCDYAGSVLPRFSLVREGIIQSMTKIDPTWYGKIAVAIINFSGKSLKLTYGHPFCTLILHKLDKPCSKILNLRDTPALGKESIRYFLKIGKEVKTRSCLRG